MSKYKHLCKHAVKHGRKTAFGLCILAALLLVMNIPAFDTASVTTFHSLFNQKDAGAAKLRVKKGRMRIERRAERMRKLLAERELHGADNAHTGVIIGLKDFPAFEKTVYPVTRIPNWGEMTDRAEWSRPFEKIPLEELVAVPKYDLKVLTTPLEDLLSPRNSKAITAKLFYSTRFFGRYDLDAPEFSGKHVGVDLKLAEGTPVSSIAGGLVRSVETTDAMGLRIIIEHRIKGFTYYSIYGHLAETQVSEGDVVHPGTIIGTVGMTGNTASPHLHLQVDRGIANTIHEPYAPKDQPPRETADLFTVNPIEFIEEYN